VGSGAHLPDSTSLAHAYLQLGRAHAESGPGHHEEAIENLNHALTLARQHHNVADQEHAHAALARTWERRGEHRQGLYHARLALELCRTLDQPVWEAAALNTVGWFAAHLGDYETARAHCEAALDRCQNDPGSRANYLDSLGYIEYRTGHHGLAIERYQQALSLFRDQGNVYDCADTLDHLGHPYAALGQPERARAVWRQALELCRSLDRVADAERIQRQLDA
jgi:tetratricopeptide (TPR) repeat protein